MKRIKWMLILLSALLQSIPFIIPIYAHWLTFFFLLPLFFLFFKRQQLSFCNGFVWGLVAFAINYYGLFYFFIEQGKTEFKWLAWFFLWFYVATYAGIWLKLSSKLITFVSEYQNHTLSVLVIFSISTVAYFYWLGTSLLWLFGAREGTLFSFPLVPLVVQPQWLKFLPLFNKYFLLFILILLQGCFSLFLATGCTKYAFLSLLLIMPFLYGWIKPFNQQKPPVWFSQIGFLIPNHLDNAYDCAQELMQQIQSLSENSRVQIIIGPESTFPFPLNKYKQCLAMISENGLESRHLIIGAHKKSEHKLYNSLYWINQCRIIFTYDKKHLTPFTETLSNIWKKIGITKNLFLHKNKEFFGGHHSTRTIKINKLSFYPMICSELFFTDQVPAIHTKSVILLLANDYWFSADYLKRLMALVAQFKSIEWNHQILYISHDFRLLFSDFLRYTDPNDNY